MSRPSTIARPSPIARSLLVRAAGQTLLPETSDEAEPLLVEAVLDTLCEMLGVDGERDRRSASD